MTVSVSSGPGTDYWSYLLDVDAILRQYGARPHWASCISIVRKTCRRSIRAYHDFQAIRRKMDPAGRFLNDHLRNLFA